MTSAVAEAAAELARDYLAATHLIPQPDQDTPAMITGTHCGTGSRPPWNTQAADATMDIHAAVRTLEQELTLEVTGHPARPRGGSTGNTIAAIHKIAALTTSKHTARTLHHLGTPPRRLKAIDQEETFKPIRYTHDAPRPPLCPYCDHPSLRLGERSGTVLCYYPHCQDTNGRRPHGHLDMNHLTSEPVIAWNDGLTT